MKLWALLLLFGTTQLFAQSAVQQTSAKEALLIANGDYAHFGKLPNPTNDARLLGATLQKIGFNVTLVENASREGMLDALSAFEERLKASRGIAFFHYGGHGVQVAGHNYLIPADADIPDEKRVATRAVELEEVMSTMDASGASVNVVVLDACRDNPLPKTATRSASRGLTVVEAKPKNSMIVYAAEAGSKAEDGLFTPTLATYLEQSGLSLTQVMMKVRREVAQKSQGNQTPGEYNQLFEDVYLSGGGSSLPPATQATAQIQQPVVQSKPQMGMPPVAINKGRGGVEEVESLVTPSNERRNAESVVREYLRGVESKDEAAVFGCLADQVDYYSMGRVTKAKALDDIRGDWKRYSDYRAQISDFQMTGPSNCQFVYEYTTMQGARPRHGILLMNVAMTSDTSPVIISIKAKVLAAK